MIPGSYSLNFGGQAWVLLPGRALWWPARETLIVADVHLGKDAVFRRAGLPVPAGGDDKDLARLAAMLTATAAKRLVILGDLVHGRASHESAMGQAVERWREQTRAVEVLLVRGNHDRGAGLVPKSWNVREVDEPFDDGGVVFSHAPREDPRGPVLAGHVHPVFAARDFDRSTVRVPCFVFDGDRRATLPAFGSFTGGFRVEKAEGHRVFLAAGSKVVAI